MTNNTATGISLCHDGSNALDIKMAEAQRYRREIGQSGEEFVTRQELFKLEKIGYAGHTKDTSQILEAHFDRLSLNAYANPLCIEVKSTTRLDPHTDFYMSAEELEVAINCARKGIAYEIHRVYGVGGHNIGRHIIPSEILFLDYGFRCNEITVYKKY